MDVAKLKEPSESPKLLEALMRKACADLELLSTVSAARLGGESARAKPGGNPPRGGTNKNIDELRRRYKDCKCNWDRLKVIKEAQQALRKAQGLPETERRRGTRAWRNAIANDTRASAKVGVDFGVSASYVRKLRGELRKG